MGKLRKAFQKIPGLPGIRCLYFKSDLNGKIGEKGRGIEIEARTKATN